MRAKGTALRHDLHVHARQVWAIVRAAETLLQLRHTTQGAGHASLQGGGYPPRRAIPRCARGAVLDECDWPGPRARCSAALGEASPDRVYGMVGQLAGCGWSIRIPVFGVPAGREYRAQTKSGCEVSFLQV